MAGENLAIMNTENSDQKQRKAFRLELLPASGTNNSAIWGLTFDLPGEKVNIFSQEVMTEFEDLLSQFENNSKNEQKIDALILFSGKPGNFIAGADIKMFQAIQTIEDARALSRKGQMLANRWEDLPFPTIAAVNGSALGGGCELCLASTAIAMSSDRAAKIGLPEVLLGIIPGMGGCVRLPRKVGLTTALDMILTGKTLSGDRALKAGLADAFLPKEGFGTAVLQWVRTNLSALKAGKRLAKNPKLGGIGGPVGKLFEKVPMGRSIIFKKAKEGVLEKTKGQYPAALEILDTLQATGASFGPRVSGSPLARNQAMEREADGFAKCAMTEVSKNLVRLFFLTEGVKKATGLSAGVNVPSKPVGSAAVLGAGVMGGGIAQLFADKDISVRMKDLNSQALEAGIKAASKTFLRNLKKKRINQRQFLQKLNRIAPVLDFSGFSGGKGADVVVEAVVENMVIKQKVFKELEEQVNDSCIIASNTSSLSISQMQIVMRKPERFVGMHFFNPVHKMPLIEVIRGEKSSDEAVSTIFQLSKKLGKTPIVVKDSPGFLVNRLLRPYLNEAAILADEGVSIKDIDRVLLEFGMPMGPIELIDEIGIDVAEKVAHILQDAFGERCVSSPINGKAVAAGLLGKKNGKGFYLYPEKSGGKGEKAVNPVFQKLVSKPSGNAGATPRVSDQEILERCIFTMINEADQCLEEEVVSNAATVDLGMIMGTGFPPFRGGLLRYADTIGASEIVKRLQEYQKKYQDKSSVRFEPAPALLKRAESGTKFYEA